MLGTGSGLFAAPNTTAIMNSVPADTRGVSSGMRATFQNSASLFSIGVFFSIIISGLAATIPSTFYNGLTRYGVPAQAAQRIANLPPTGALFGAFLGYNPIGVLLPASVRAHISPSNLNILLGKDFFPNLISRPFMVGLHAAFYISAAMCVVAAVASLLRGKRYINEGSASGESAPADTEPPVIDSMA